MPLLDAPAKGSKGAKPLYKTIPSPLGKGRGKKGEGWVCGLWRREMGEEKRLIEDRLDKLSKRMAKSGYNGYMVERVKELVGELQQREVYCVDRFVQKLLYRLDDKEEYLDILMEGRFAIILARNGFSKIFIEYCEEGPDLISSDRRMIPTDGMHSNARGGSVVPMHP